MRQGACTKGCVCALDSYINPSFVCLFDLTPFIGVGFVYVWLLFVVFFDDELTV